MVNLRMVADRQDGQDDGQESRNQNAVKKYQNQGFQLSFFKSHSLKRRVYLAYNGIILIFDSPG